MKVTETVNALDVHDEDFTFREHLGFIEALVRKAHEELTMVSAVIGINGGLGKGHEAEVVRLADAHDHLERALHGVSRVIEDLPWADD